jgi:hypothetical protein
VLPCQKKQSVEPYKFYQKAASGYMKCEICWTAIENAYNGVLVFQRTLDALGTWQREFVVFHDVRPVFGFWPTLVVASKSGKPVALSSDTFDSLVGRQQRLVLERARLESPGSWDIAGIGAALEVIRKFVNDRHERRKDKEYRAPLERERLATENDVLRTKALQDRISLAKSLGATDEDLAPLVNQLLFKPLDELARFQDRGLITGAKLLKSDEEDSDEDHYEDEG